MLPCPSVLFSDRHLTKTRIVYALQEDPSTGRQPALVDRASSCNTGSLLLCEGGPGSCSAEDALPGRLSQRHDVSYSAVGANLCVYPCLIERQKKGPALTLACLRKRGIRKASFWIGRPYRLRRHRENGISHNPALHLSLSQSCETYKIYLALEHDAGESEWHVRRSSLHKQEHLSLDRNLNVNIGGG